MRTTTPLLAWRLGLVAALAAGCGETQTGPGSASASAGGGAAGTEPQSSEAGQASTDTGGQAGASSTAESGEAGELASAGAGAGGTGPSPCDSVELAGLQVHVEGTWEQFGYPPYALDGCTLVYVAATAGADNGALRLRQLATGDELELDAASAHPRRPVVAGGVVAWESDGTDGSQVRLRDSTGGKLFEKAFQRAGEPRASVDAVVFTAFVGDGASGDTDVSLYDLTTRELTTIATGPGQQRFADVSPTHVAVTDFSEDPRGYFAQADSIADILLIDRKTGERTLRAATGKQAFPLLGSDGVLAYLEWGDVHPEPKFSQFMLMAGHVQAPAADDRNVKGSRFATISTMPAYVRPSVHGKFVDYIDGSAAVPSILRADLVAGTAPVATTVGGASRLLGPVATPSFTLVAKDLGSSTAGLLAVVH